MKYENVVHTGNILETVPFVSHFNTKLHDTSAAMYVKCMFKFFDKKKVFPRIVSALFGHSTCG